MISKTLSRIFSTLSAAACLTACSSYDVTINDQVVYTPPPLYSDFSIADPALSECLKSTIRERQIVKAGQLSELLCPAGNISSLEGITQFPNITKLGLGNNKLKDLAGVQVLTQLQHLDASGNNLTELTELNGLKKLRYVDLRRNNALVCTSIDRDAIMTASDNLKLELPQHCE